MSAPQSEQPQPRRPGRQPVKLWSDVRAYLSDARGAVSMSGDLPLHRRAVHITALGLLSLALGANSLHDLLWSAGDRMGRWAHR